ncbi:hypothetical protein BpHYR1_054080 [Brachionus plicatilis]|uniref:Uncharacterized protein n=1 Tax=Brachionus plicatilis TaxID=10195 RepID=A0A3M7PP52_BRAPC|nr:hypothetical protein BpHYR1_054080 [Brachionus plicatilis]
MASRKNLLINEKKYNITKLFKSPKKKNKKNIRINLSHYSIVTWPNRRTNFQIMMRKFEI